MNKLRTALLFIFFLPRFYFPFAGEENAWIRINLVGYKPSSIKVAVWCSKVNKGVLNFQLAEASWAKLFLCLRQEKNYGAYGPFLNSFRLNFSSYTKAGRYYLTAGGTKSSEFTIGEDVYNGSADFCLRYMRQQRSGFNPFLKDSCHTHDGYTMYGPMPDCTHIDVVGDGMMPRIIYNMLPRLPMQPIIYWRRTAIFLPYSGQKAGQWVGWKQ